LFIRILERYLCPTKCEDNATWGSIDSYLQVVLNQLQLMQMNPMPYPFSRHPPWGFISNYLDAQHQNCLANALHLHIVNEDIRYTTVL
ncbi:hypothetical protein MKW98_030488, partial [Papaver atlanticum]